jgi:hypothetical protein
MISNKGNYIKIISWLMGILFLAIGILNMFWGNDPGFGIFILLLSFIYIPPFEALLQKWIRIKIPGILKLFLGIFILWAALGVGELFDKIDLMMRDYQSLFAKQ